MPCCCCCCCCRDRRIARGRARLGVACERSYRSGPGAGSPAVAGCCPGCRRAGESSAGLRITYSCRRGGRQGQGFQLAGVLREGGRTLPGAAPAGVCASIRLQGSATCRAPEGPGLGKSALPACPTAPPQVPSRPRLAQLSPALGSTCPSARTPNASGQTSSSRGCAAKIVKIKKRHALPTPPLQAAPGRRWRRPQTTAGRR